MAYSTISECKKILRISGSDFDTELTEMIADADALIDGILQEYETVPLTGTIPSAVAKASKYIACGLFKRLYPSSDMDEKMAGVYKTQGEEFLESYIKSTHLKPQAKED